MSLEGWVAAWMLAGLSAYAVLGGADFGGGVWDLLARGPRAADRRRAVAHAMGPVWEANHVWLVFSFIILLSGFPAAFRAFSIALFIPVHLVLAGIVLRGASFAFRVAGLPARAERFWAAVFGCASVITPLGLGAALGAISTGGITINGHVVTAPPLASWLAPFAIGTGILALVTCAYLAAVYLTAETEGELREDFRRRALISGAALLLVALLIMPLMVVTAPSLWGRFSRPGPLLLAGLGILLAAGALTTLWQHRYRTARVIAAAQVAVMFWSWSAAQLPYLIYPDLTLTQAASPPATLRFMLTALPIGALLLVPALILLFKVAKLDAAPS